jgi:hypothetical protein
MTAPACHANARNATPTLSRGRPALPVYRQGVGVPACYRAVVDNCVAVDNSPVPSTGPGAGPGAGAGR